MRELVPANARTAIARTQVAADFSHIASLDQVKPPYPERFTTEWWALRKRTLELIGQRQARLRGSDRPSRAELEFSTICTGTSLDDELSTQSYEQLDPATGLHVHLSPALRAMREKDPERFAALTAEARRLQAMGRPRSVPLARAMP